MRSRRCDNTLTYLPMINFIFTNKTPHGCKNRILSVSGWCLCMEGKGQAKIAADVEVKARGWSWSWSWKGSWIWSWELAGAPEMAAGASPPPQISRNTV